MADLVGIERMRVNAPYSQPVPRQGKGLRVAACDFGGMVQAIERVSDLFAFGVQWRPEHLFYARRRRCDPPEEECARIGSRHAFPLARQCGGKGR